MSKPLKIPPAKKPTQPARPFVDYKERLAKDPAMLFSFQFYTKSPSELSCVGANSDWFVHLFDRLRSVSSLKPEECRQAKSLRYHRIDWDDVKHRFPTVKPEMLYQIEEDCWQFALSKSKGRVHGFLINNRFYVVWLDPQHHLYPGKKR